MSESADPLYNAVASTCYRLQGDYLADPSTRQHHSARATLAELRRGGTLDPEKNPLVIEKALFAMQGDFPERLSSKKDEASPSEHAAFVALSLFSLHMQGAREPMHAKNASFAAACGRLNALGKSSSIKPRIDAMLLANNEQSRLMHIRSLVTLLRSESIGFDYGQLAQDLRSLGNPEKRPGIQLRWGREFANSHFRNTKSAVETPTF